MTGSVKIARPAVTIANKEEATVLTSMDIVKDVKWELKLITMTASTKDKPVMVDVDLAFPQRET
jgi:hypothetical protein